MFYQSSYIQLKFHFDHRRLRDHERPYCYLEILLDPIELPENTRTHTKMLHRVVGGRVASLSHSRPFLDHMMVKKRGEMQTNVSFVSLQSKASSYIWASAHCQARQVRSISAPICATQPPVLPRCKPTPLYQHPPAVALLPQCVHRVLHRFVAAIVP